MISLIKISWPYILAFCVGFYFAALIFGAKINQQKIDYLTEKKTFIENSQQALTESLLTNDQLNLELIKKQDELVIKSQELDRSIADAIKKDGDNFSGLGNNSLQLYKQSLGYRDEGKATTSNDKAAH